MARTKLLETGSESHYRFRHKFGGKDSNITELFT
jgi:hypothetical protein